MRSATYRCDRGSNRWPRFAPKTYRESARNLLWVLDLAPRSLASSLISSQLVHSSIPRDGSSSSASQLGKHHLSLARKTLHHASLTLGGVP